MKLDSVYNYFNEIKEKMHTDAQIVIAYNWRRHQNRKRKKLEKKKSNHLKQQKSNKVPNYMLPKGGYIDKVYKGPRVGNISGGGGATNI